MEQKQLITAQMLEEDQGIIWAATGRYFGYPACCIAYFIHRANEIASTGRLVPISRVQNLVMDGHGFIPCPECAGDTHIGTGGGLHVLIVNRHCPAGYPNGGLDIPTTREIARRVQSLWDEYQAMLKAVKPERLPNYVKGGVV